MTKRDHNELEAAQLLLDLVPTVSYTAGQAEGFCGLKSAVARLEACSSSLLPSLQQQAPGELSKLSPRETSGRPTVLSSLPFDGPAGSDTPACSPGSLRTPPTPVSPGSRAAKAGRLVSAQKRSQPAETLCSHPHLHPVIELGWQPLCAVHCNGFTGQFYGGHDRDLYVRCTSGAYGDRPLTDAAQGGSIMTCSGFEKAAGRELSKKWKESIHVVGEGEGSRATLVSWLRRKSQCQHGQQIVGRDVWILWINEAAYYQAHVEAYSPETGKHKVRYSDSLVEELYMPVEQIKFDGDPILPMGGGASLALDSSLACFEDVGAEPGGNVGEHVSSLFHQNSSVSADSHVSIIEEAPPVDIRLTKSNRHQKPRPLPTECGSERSLRRRLSGVPSSPSAAPLQAPLSTPPIPRRLRTGIRAQTSPEVAAYLSHVSEAGTPRGRFLPGPPDGEREPAEVKAKPMTPIQEAILPSSAAASCRASPSEGSGSLGAGSLGAPPLPPFAQGDASVMAQWMHHIALSLDGSMAPRGSAAASLARAPEGPSLIPSARFQTMLVQAMQASSIAAWYSAMASRWLFFHSHDPSVLQQKMAEFILSALYDFDQQQLHLCPPFSARHSSPTLEA